MSTSFYPETDRASERTNKTLNQCLQFYMGHSQKGWVKSLPSIWFTMMNTKNASTGQSRFQLHMGFSPRIIPPLLSQNETENTPGDKETDKQPIELIKCIQLYKMEAHNSLLQHKVIQAFHANTK